MVKLLKEMGQETNCVCLNQQMATPQHKDGMHQTSFSLSFFSPLALIWSQGKEGGLTELTHIVKQ